MRRGRQLGDGRQVVRHAHDAYAVDDALVGGQVADSCAREGERLAHGSTHCEVLVLADEFKRGGRAWITEFDVGFVHHDHRMHAFGGTFDFSDFGSVEHALEIVHLQRGAGRIVRAGEHDHGRLDVFDGFDGGVDVQREILVAVRKLPCGERVAGIFRIHRIRRIAAERNAPWTPKAWNSCSIISLDPLAPTAGRLPA